MIHEAVHEKRVSTTEAQSSSRFFQRIATEYTYLTEAVDGSQDAQMFRGLTAETISPPHDTDTTWDALELGDMEEHEGSPHN